MDTPIVRVDRFQSNELYIKREDLIPFSFGGNKARKAELFFREIDRGNFDCVVTYGSSSSNHCRVISNMAASRSMECYIISPEEASEPTFNSNMMERFGARITVCKEEEVHGTIESLIERLEKEGKKPYFIAGGGHGNIGTHSYYQCYEEIRSYEKQTGIHFDYIFHASGTGTTQAGLVCGKLINSDDKSIVGISIARKNPRGRNVVVQSVKEYLSEKGFRTDLEAVEDAVIFDDSYTGDGYGANTSAEIIEYIMNKYGIPLDSVYTGKAFGGMLDYIKKNDIGDKNILFIHTGGTPLFFDFLEKHK